MLLKMSLVWWFCPQESTRDSWEHLVSPPWWVVVWTPMVGGAVTELMPTPQA
jgi:hypothetical protein